MFYIVKLYFHHMCKLLIYSIPAYKFIYKLGASNFVGLWYPAVSCRMYNGAVIIRPHEVKPGPELPETIKLMCDTLLVVGRRSVERRTQRAAFPGAIVVTGVLIRIHSKYTLANYHTKELYRRNIHPVQTKSNAKIYRYHHSVCPSIVASDYLRQCGRMY